MLRRKVEESSKKYAYEYINIQQIHFNIYDIFYSQCSHQHVLAGISAIFRVMFLLQEYKVYNCRLVVSPSLLNNSNYNFG